MTLKPKKNGLHLYSMSKNGKTKICSSLGNKEQCTSNLCGAKGYEDKIIYSLEGVEQKWNLRN